MSDQPHVEISQLALERAKPRVEISQLILEHIPAEEVGA